MPLPHGEAAAMIDPFREVGFQSTTKTQNLECQSPQMASWGSAAKPISGAKARY